MTDLWYVRCIVDIGLTLVVLYVPSFINRNTDVHKMAHKVNTYALCVYYLPIPFYVFLVDLCCPLDERCREKCVCLYAAGIAKNSTADSTVLQQYT